MKEKKRWFRLDTAALIFPAIIRRNWNNVFRLSVTLDEKIDPAVLKAALSDLFPRFPTFFVRLRRGFFWCYLEQIDLPPEPREDFAYPLTHMSRAETRKCCIRVLYYGKRIAAEFFHSVTDGTGGSVFLQNLTARYLEIRHRIDLPKGGDLKDLSEEPKEEETRDGFRLCAGKFPAKRKEEKAYRLRGSPEPDGFRHLITGILPTDALKKASERYGVSVTSFLSAVMTYSIIQIQNHERKEKRALPVKITVPVNLRKLYGVPTLRNFVLPINVGVDPRTGGYSLSDLCRQFSGQITSEAVPQKMAAKIASNVIPQDIFFIRILPLPVKNFVMRAVYMLTGERGGCINISNLGVVRMPEEASKHVERMEFIIGVQYSYPHNCSVVSFGGKTAVNMIRSSRESELERLFFSKLVEEGVPVDIESNRRKDE